LYYNRDTILLKKKTLLYKKVKDKVNCLSDIGVPFLTKAVKLTKSRFYMLFYSYIKL